MRHQHAFRIAEQLVEKFKPACKRIEIAGSVRRCKPEVKDIEIVAIPDLTRLPYPRAEFGKPVPVVHKTLLDKMLFELVCDKQIYMQKNGERYKKFIMNAEGISVDLFLVIPPAEWGVQFMIRTGPSDFSQWMVTKQVKGGALPDRYFVQDGAVWIAESEDKLLIPEEIDYFRLCGLEWIEPSKRAPRWRQWSNT